MAASDGKGLYVPPVSWDDLLDFHARHFPTSQAPATQHADVAGEEEDDDDELGYYPDGIKRTLTDEQIAMFRHSEIQTLLREKKRCEEAARDAQDEGCRSAKSSVNQAEGLQQKSKQPNEVHKRRRTGKKPYTHRRHARELDETKQDNVELDY